MTDRQSTHAPDCWAWGPKHYDCAVREIERLRSIISDIKDWDCDVSGGFLSIPVALRRRMQEAIDAHPPPASDVARLGEAPDEHALSQPAEVEALRAEVERLTLEMGRLQQQYDERTACMIVHRGQALACSDAMRTAYSDERRRADKLAEALRLIESAKERGFGIDYARGVAQSALPRDQEE